VSPWLDGGPHPARPRLDRELAADVCVIGAGIVGLSAALELERGGARVIVLEGRQVGSAVTGNTTAKLSSLHGLAYDELRSTRGVEAASIYAAANELGIERVRQTAERLAIDCDLRRKPNFTYTKDPERRGELEAEVEAANAAGLPAVLTDDTDLPFEVAAAVRLDDQAEFHPVKYLRGIADALDRDGQTVYEQTRAIGLSRSAVATESGHQVVAERVIVATQMPFLDRGLFFARCPVQRSYGLTVRLAGEPPQGMYLSAETPTRSMRAVPVDGGELLLVGGAGHELGHGDAAESYRDLESFARRTFDVQGFEHRWSAHDFMPEDGLPYVGRLLPFSDRVLTATGMRKWGLAMGAAAGSILADLALGRDNASAGAFDPWRLPPLRAVPSYLKLGADTSLHLVGDRVKRGGGAADLGPGEGRVVGDGLRQKAVHRDDSGVLHAVSARCTHLGCIVAWNGADRTWDCPCHGSRFDAMGEVLTGPATRSLKPERPPAD
jgi:glycine/D-amino acid oxidase-like deaminating enzyme/nitrite reductase/ring-hydroxylating ferredoxin subunit